MALAIVKRPDWGWASAGVGGCALAAVALLGAFVVRSARHPAAVVEPSMLRIRAFAVAGVASFLFAVAFAAMLLASVLFLTGVWHYSVLRAGLAIVPGPSMAALFSVISGRLVGRYSHRSLAALGATLFAAGCLLWSLRIGTAQEYATTFLPSMLIGGVGVGLVLSPLSSAAAASVPPARFATGIGVLTMARQVGSVLGVAVLVAILGTGSPAGAVASFHNAWIAMVAASAASAATALCLGRVAILHAPAREQAAATFGVQEALVGRAG